MIQVARSIPAARPPLRPRRSSGFRATGPAADEWGGGCPVLEDDPAAGLEPAVELLCGETMGGEGSGE